MDGSHAAGNDVNATGFAWSGGAFTPVPSLPGESVSFVWDLSNDGAVAVGESWDGSHHIPIRWSAATGTVPLGTLQPGETGSAKGVSADGSVVVGWSGSKPFRWTASGGMQPLATASFGYAYGVSADGAIVVGSAQFGLQHQAFRWTEVSGAVGLGTLPGHSSSGASAISADGSTIVGGVSASGNQTFTAQPFRWTQAGGMVGLGNPPGCERGGATGVSGDGAVIIGDCLIESEEVGYIHVPFVWTAETGTLTLQDFLSQRGVVLDDPLTAAELTAVSDDGRVIAVVETPFEFVRPRLIDVTPAAVPGLPPLGALGLATALLYIGMRSSSSRAT
jgi:probable HAF family extracellular repeat protein